MDQRVEPPRWLPEGAAPDADDEVTPNGSAHKDDGGEANSVHHRADDAGAGDVPGGPGTAGADAGGPAVDGPAAGPESFNGSTDSFADDDGYSHAGQETVSAEVGPPLYHTPVGAYADVQADSYGYQQESPFSAEYAADSGYNHEVMSQPAGEDPAVPPYPAEVPPEPSTATTTVGVSAFATAAYRAIPRPKIKSRPARPRDPATSKGATSAARRANLVVARFEPWSVMKFSFLMSLVAWVVLFVAVALLYYTLSAVGVFAALQKTLESVTSSQGSAGVNLSKWTSASRVLGYTMLIGAVNIVLITALSTVGAMIYNLVTHLGGGIEVTLKESD